MSESVTRSDLTVALSLALVGMLGLLATDIYLPALPAVAQSLHASQKAMELTVSTYLLGSSIGQLLWGPISDRYGRRRPLICGYSLFVIGSIGCAMSRSGQELLLWRCAQALGVCSGVVLTRAMMRDYFAGNRVAQMMSIAMMLATAAPLVAPSIGVQLLHLGSWNLIFWALAGLGVASIAAIAMLPETLPHAKRDKAPLWRHFAGYVTLLTHRHILAYAGVLGCMFSGLFAYTAGAPYAYIKYYHLSPQAFALLLGVTGGLVMLTTLLNARLVMALGGFKLIRIGASIAALAGVLTAVSAVTGFGGFWGLALPLMALVSMNSFLIANAFAGAMHRFPAKAGLVSALLGGLQLGAGAIGATIVGAMANGTPMPMAIVVCVSGLGCAACAWLLLADPGREAVNVIHPTVAPEGQGPR